MKAFTTMDEYGSRGKLPTDLLAITSATVGKGARKTAEHTIGAVLEQSDTHAAVWGFVTMFIAAAAAVEYAMVMTFLLNLLVIMSTTQQHHRMR